MTISEELELDVSPALAALRDIDDSFSEMVSSFRESLAEAAQAFDAAPLSAAVIEAGETGAAGLTESINDSLADVDAELVSETIATAGEEGGESVSDSLTGAIEDFDASPIGDEISGAVSEADVEIVPEADVSDIPGDIESAVEEADTRIAIEADTDPITEGIDDAVSAADTAIEFDDVDASFITDAIEDAVSSADTSVFAEIGEQASQGAGGLADLASQGLETASVMSAAGTATAGLGGSITGLVTKFGPMGAAIGGVTAGITSFVSEATDAALVQDRINRLFGDAAPLIEDIDIGGLNTSISELAVNLGGSDEGLRNAIGNFAQLANAAGLPQDEIVETSKRIVALSANAVALRPALGDVGGVAESLGNAFIRGGRALIPYGIDLTKAEISAHALALGLAETEEAITAADRVVAGSDLAFRKYGDTIGKNVASATDSAAFQFRQLKTSLGELVESLGGPLLDPLAKLFDLLGKGTDFLAATIGKIDEADKAFSEFFLGPREEADALTGALSSLTLTTEEFGASTAEASPLIADAQAKVASYAAMVNAEVPGVGDTLGKLADDHVTSFAKIRDAFAEQLKQEASFITHIQTIITNGAPEVAKRVLELGVTRGAALAEALAKNKVDQLAQLESQALEINETERRLSDTEAEAKIQALAAGISKRMNIPKEAALAMIRETGNAAANEAKPQGEKTGASFADGTSGGVNSRRGDIERAGVGAAQALGAGAGTAHSEGQDVGNNFVSGLVGVLRAGASGAIAAAARAAGAAMKPAANAGQRASSPSKDAMDVADNFVDGLELGLEKRERDAAAAAKALTEAMIPTVPQSALNLGAFPIASQAVPATALSGGSSRSLSVSVGAINLSTIFNPDDPMSKRRVGQELREIIGQLEGENL